MKWCKLEYKKNVHALLNAGKFEDGDAVPRDHEDLLIFFQDYNLTAQFENIVSLLKLAQLETLIAIWPRNFDKIINSPRSRRGWPAHA